MGSHHGHLRIGRQAQGNFALIILILLSVMELLAAEPPARMPDLPDGFPWKNLHLQVVAFIGTVTAFDTPVYDLTVDKSPVSIVHIDAEKYLTGSWEPTEFISLAAVYCSEKHDQMVFHMGSSPSAVFLKPGMRIIAIAWRRPPGMDVDRKNIDRYGERFRLSFVREIGDTTLFSGKAVHELSRPRLGDTALMEDVEIPKSGHIPAEQLVLLRQPEKLTLEQVVDLIEEYYNTPEGTRR